MARRERKCASSARNDEGKLRVNLSKNLPIPFDENTFDRQIPDEFLKDLPGEKIVKSSSAIETKARHHGTFLDQKATAPVTGGRPRQAMMHLERVRKEYDLRKGLLWRPTAPRSELPAGEVFGLALFGARLLAAWITRDSPETSGRLASLDAFPILLRGYRLLDLETSVVGGRRGFAPARPSTCLLGGFGASQVGGHGVAAA